MNDALDDTTPPQDARRLWQAAGQGFSQLFRSAPAYETIEVRGGRLAVTGVPVPDLNCGVVMGDAGAADATGALADELRSRDLPGILLLPDSASPEATEAARASGMTAVARMPLMTRGPGGPPPDPRFRTRTATTPGDLASANRLIASAFELPPGTVSDAFRPTLLSAADVAIEVIRDGEEPVGCLQVTAHGPLVGIWSMATPPEHRRRGVARAGLGHVLTHRLPSAASRAFLIATDAGRPLYDALGFETVAWCSAWLWQPTAGAGDGRR